MCGWLCWWVVLVGVVVVVVGVGVGVVVVVAVVVVVVVVDDADFVGLAYFVVGCHDDADAQGVACISQRSNKQC